MMDAFDGVYLIRVDVDEWNWDTLQLDYSALGEGIPLFYRLDTNGRSTGDWINGNAWGENTPQNIANAMGPWFHR